MNLLLLLALFAQKPLSAIDEVCQRAVDQELTPGISVAIVKNQEVAYARGYGWADREKKIQARANTVYRVGSVTKQFTAMSILMLEEEGRLQIDKPVSTYLPSVSVGGQKMTLRRMLNHTSGLRDIKELAKEKERFPVPPSLQEVSRIIGSEPLDFDPGDRFAYGNSGYILASEVLEAVTGSTLHDFLGTRILEPLHMSSSVLATARQPAVADLAVGYIRNEEDRTWKVAPVRSAWMSRGAGAMMSSASDLARWAAALQAQEFVSAETYRTMYSPGLLNDGTTIEYGLGWRLPEPFEGHTLVAHGGGASGFSAYVGHFPSDYLTVIILVNREGFPPRGILNRVASLMLE